MNTDPQNKTKHLMKLFAVFMGAYLFRYVTPADYYVPVPPTATNVAVNKGFMMATNHYRQKRDIKQGAVSIRKTVLPGMAIPMLKIRRPNGRLIFNMEITIRR